MGVCVAGPNHACGGGVVDGRSVKPAGSLALVLSRLDGCGEILGPRCCKGHGIATHELFRNVTVPDVMEVGYRRVTTCCQDWWDDLSRGLRTR